MLKKKVLVFLICGIFVLSSVSIPAFGSETGPLLGDDLARDTIIDANTAISTKVMSEAKEWLKSNYEEFYDIRNIRAHITKQVDMKEKSRYTVSLYCETMYKYNSVEEIPFVQGLMSIYDRRNISKKEQDVLNSQIKQIAEDAAFGEYTELFVDVVVEIENIDDSVPYKMYYQDGIDTTLHEINLLKLDSQELYSSGVKCAEFVMESISDAVETESITETRGYADYDRFAARDYARTYSSNATGCNKCAAGACNILQNTLKWNTAEYPYFSVFLHNDCADFVSQAMSEGGIPEKSGWYRDKNGASGTWTQSWTVVPKLETYMTRSDHVYWDESTFAACNAGNILITNSGEHIVMVDFNDGTTHKFTGHTNDRKSYVFGNASTYQYYVINRSS